MLWEVEVKNEQSGNKCMPGIRRGRKNYDIKKVVKKKFLNELNKLDTIEAQNIEFINSVYLQKIASIHLLK